MTKFSKNRPIEELFKSSNYWVVEKPEFSDIVTFKKTWEINGTPKYENVLNEAIKYFSELQKHINPEDCFFCVRYENEAHFDQLEDHNPITEITKRLETAIKSGETSFSASILIQATAEQVEILTKKAPPQEIKKLNNLGDKTKFVPISLN